MRPAILALLTGCAVLPAAAHAGSLADWAPAIFSRLDENSDGRVTSAEMAAAKSARFDRVDANGDGALDADEIAAQRARIARVAAAADVGIAGGTERADRDGDGRVSRDEYTAEGPVFALMDADGDGTVSRPEFDRAVAILSR